MRNPLGVFIFIVIMVLLDLYVFQAVRSVSQHASPRTRGIITTVYWFITLSTIVAFLVFAFTTPQTLSKSVRIYLFAIVVGLFLSKLVAISFLMIDDLRRLIQWVAGKLMFNNTEGEKMAGDGISRSAFLSWLALAAGTTLFGSLLVGFRNKYNYTTRKVKLNYPNLPGSFRGLKIVHISDIHCGSFMHPKEVEDGIRLILDQEPDVIFFTGDLVNDRASEMAPYMEMFRELKAPLGVYSVLGNHDYGDYASWPFDGISKEQNMRNLHQVHASLGWRLLINEHAVIQKDEEKIAILGVENWSARGRFPKYGKLQDAYAGTAGIPFKILLSHDPSHWEEEVQKAYKDIDLTLSGHTHGMQFGVEVPGFKWSPVQYMYRYWAGLYGNDQQKLYVNRGFGFIGYPGRVGILPEITVIELA